MPTGFDIPYTPYSKWTEIKKLCIFVGIELTIALIAVTYKFLVVNRSVLGPTDAQLREKDQHRHPEIWAEYERQYRARRSSGRPYTSFSLARRSSSNVAAVANVRNTVMLVRSDTAESHPGKGPAVEGLETVEEATEEASPSPLTRQASFRGMDNVLMTEDENGNEKENDEDEKEEDSAALTKTRPKLRTSVTYAAGTNAATLLSNSPSIPDRSSSRNATMSRPEMSEVFPTLAALQTTGTSSLYDSPRGRSPASIVRMYSDEANEETAEDEADAQAVARSTEADQKGISSSDEVQYKAKGSNADGEQAEYEAIKPASPSTSRSAYKQSGSPIDKYGRRGRESVSPKELKRNGVLDSVRDNIRKSLVDEDDD